MTDSSSLTVLVELASNFGPFLFAILFIVFVTRTAYGWYSAALTRKEPPRSEEETKLLAFYFRCSVWCGVAAATLSCVWWVYNQTRGTHTYQAAIVELDKNDTILSNFFAKRIDRPVGDGSVPIHDIFIVFVRDAPFQIGERFSISYYRVPESATSGGGLLRPQEVIITYQGHSQDTFRIKSEPGKPPTLELTPVNTY